MKYECIKGLIGKKVIVIDIDGGKIKGTFTNTVSEFDTASGKEEMEIDAGAAYYGIPLEEVKEIIPIEKDSD